MSGYFDTTPGLGLTQAIVKFVDVFREGNFHWIYFVHEIAKQIIWPTFDVGYFLLIATCLKQATLITIFSFDFFKKDVQYIIFHI